MLKNGPVNGIAPLLEAAHYSYRLSQGNERQNIKVNRSESRLLSKVSFQRKKKKKEGNPAEIPTTLTLFSKVVVRVNRRVMSCQSNGQTLIHGDLNGSRCSSKS